MTKFLKIVGTKKENKFDLVALEFVKTGNKFFIVFLTNFTPLVLLEVGVN